MANKLYEEKHIQDIANAIRGKTGKTDSLLVSAMAEEIEGITTKSDPVLQDKTVTENGEVVADEGYDGLGTVTVDVVEDLTNLVELLGDGEIDEDSFDLVMLPQSDIDELVALFGGNVDDIDSIKEHSQTLIDLANTTTGNTDTNLTDGVNALVEGYGQGGSGGGNSSSVTITCQNLGSPKTSTNIEFVTSLSKSQVSVNV